VFDGRNQRSLLRWDWVDAGDDTTSLALYQFHFHNPTFPNIYGISSRLGFGIDLGLGGGSK
jgi:hypothetical protein